MEDKPRPKRAADWEAIEREYRTGKWSDQELADHFDNIVSRQAIWKRARKGGWQKDLSAEVRRATRAGLIADELEKRNEGVVAGVVADGLQKVANTVQVAAEVAKNVILRHRSDILSTRGLALDMLGELSLATHSQEELAALFKQASEGLDPESLVALQQSFKDMVRLHSRVGSIFKLSASLKTLQEMERKAFSLDAEPDDDNGAANKTISDADRVSRIATIVARATKAADADD